MQKRLEMVPTCPIIERRPDPRGEHYAMSTASETESPPSQCPVKREEKLRAPSVQGTPCGSSRDTPDKLYKCHNLF